MRCDGKTRCVMTLATVFSAAFLYSGVVLAQDAPPPQSQSVADAARQAREAKKNAAKPTKVISDDDIDTRNVKPGAEGLNVGSRPKSDSQPPNAAAVSAVEATDAASAAAETNPSAKAGDDPEIAKVKEQVAEATRQLDLLQRGLALDQDSYYSKPDFASDKGGKTKLEAEQQLISDKQQEVDQLKAHLAELQEARNRKKTASGTAAGTSSSDAEKPAELPASAPPPAPPQS
jgi:hypothetical protein